jgi:hypothetical protein
MGKFCSPLGKCTGHRLLGVCVTMVLEKGFVGWKVAVGSCRGY